jgi:RimJ/RimL family protein N-acetyltransferase
LRRDLRTQQERPKLPLPLTTERLLLRPATIDDLEAWHAIARDAEEAWFGEASSPLDDSRAKLERHIEHQHRYGFALWAVELRSTGEVIGVTGLTHLEDGSEIEVGYRFLRRCWCYGYATEAAKAALAFGLDELDLERIVAVTLPDNAGSRRVMEKCGLRFAGTTHVYGHEHVKYEISS